MSSGEWKMWKVENVLWRVENENQIWYSSAEWRVESGKWDWKVESGKWKTKSGVESGECGEWKKYEIAINQAVVRCSLIAS
jgi:hypothetical protein